MTRPTTSTEGARLRDYLLITVVGLAVLMPFLGQTRDLASHEVRHAEVAREMSVSGDFFIPTLLERQYRDKPPVLHAPVALLYRLTGQPSILLARLPSAVAAILGALALYGIGLTLADRRTALLAALAVLGVQGFANMARTARPDMIFCMGLLFSWLGLVRAMRPGGSASSVAWLVLAGLGAGIASLAKGPLGLILPIIFALVAPVGRQDLKWPTITGWLVFTAAMLLTAACWAWPVYLRDHGIYLSQVVFQPDLDVEANTGRHPIWWYLWYLVAGLLPLTLLIPVLAVDIKQRGWRVTILAPLLMLLVLSLFPKKRIHYLLPLYPLLTLAVAETVMRLSDRRWILHTAHALVGISLLAGPVYFGLIQPRLFGAEEPALTFARQIVQLAPANVQILCAGDIAEPIAFRGQRGKVAVWRDQDLLVKETIHAGRGSFLVIPEDEAGVIRAKLGTDWSLNEKLAASLGSGKKAQRWLLVQLDSKQATPAP